MSPTPTILEMAGVTKGFADSAGRVEVLRGISLTISPGEFVIITGPSGSGKSTLLNLVALLDKPDCGSILFVGRETTTLPDHDSCVLRAGEIGMVFQKFHLLPHRSALDNVLFRWRYVSGSGGDRRAASERALAQVGLAGIMHRPARLLSAGEMQRVAIARAVALPPRLLVADEPTGNLDKASAATVMECFEKLNRDGMTIIMATHNEALLRFASRRFACEDGILKSA
jgi:ABC-type lipoprotein export system ATPase subunit